MQYNGKKKKKQRIIDKGWKNYISELRKDPQEVVIGVLAEVGGNMDEGGEGITLYEKAITNEFGIGIPKRPAFRTTFELHERSLIMLAKKMDNAVFQQQLTINQAYDRIGETHKGQIQTVMSNGRKHFQLNSENWAEIKGGTPDSVTPLIWTGQYRGSINHKTRKR